MEFNWTIEIRMLEDNLSCFDRRQYWDPIFL